MASELIEALKSGDLEAVSAALRADATQARQARAVVEAARRAFLPGLKLLKRNGADLNASWRGYRPLHALIQEEPHAEAEQPPSFRLKCLEWLLAHGADPEQSAAWPPARALIIAAFVGSREYVDVLRRAGARLDGFTGAALGEMGFVCDLLAQRPDFVRERDEGGLTALQCAAGSRLPGARVVETARVLIDAGADVHAKTKAWDHEVDALYFAANAKNRRMFDLLLESGADPDSGLASALWNATEAFAELALAHGARPDRAVSGGRPLLNDLIRWGRLRQATWMLGRGANPNLADGEGWTALHQAASRGNKRIFEALVAAGGDVTRTDRLGRTPLDIAAAPKHPAAPAEGAMPGSIMEE
jgi:ankyrin repeat protein